MISGELRQPVGPGPAPPEELIGKKLKQPKRDKPPLIDTAFEPEPVEPKLLPPLKTLPAEVEHSEPKPKKKKPRLSRLEGGKIVGTPLIREKPRRPRTAVFD